MRYFALVADYDGTLTTTDYVAPETVAALGRLRASGRRAILVTGRRLADLLAVCECIDAFDRVVAENGAVLYDPNTRDSTSLAESASPQLIEVLRGRGVDPLEVGSTIVATHLPHATTVLNVIRELGLELQVIFSRGAVMVLPTGVNKASGVRHALSSLGLTPHETVAVGDAENDHSFLQIAECAVAVQNAIAAVKDAAAIVTAQPAGSGVVELIDRLIATDLEAVDSLLARHHMAIGRGLDGALVSVPPYGRRILIGGPSGSGKSSLASGFIERLAKKLYQVCIIDPEGDYVGLPHAATIGDEDSIPGVGEVLDLLRERGSNLNINLLGVPLADRPTYFSRLLPHLQSMRLHTGRPHWLVIDEAHHLLPPGCGIETVDLSRGLSETIMITVHADHMARSVLKVVDVVVAVGPHQDRIFGQFATSIGIAPATPVTWDSRENIAACWFVKDGTSPFPMRPIHGRAERIRHYRKYALGDLHHSSFYFRGPGARLNLRAQNLSMFCQIAEGLDDETWEFHLRRGDYTNWIRGVIKDEGLAQAVREVQERRDVPPAQSRRLVHDAIDARYCLPE